MQANIRNRMGARRDARRVPVTTESNEAVELLERAILGLAGHRADTVQWIERALAIDPGLVPALCIAAFASKALGRCDFEAPARARVEAARDALAARGGSEREHGLYRALEAWCSGQPLTAAEILERVLQRYPRDLLTFKFCHALNFILGRSNAMRTAIEGALPAWNVHVPGYGYVLGCYAFALEETGDLERAEALGRRAVALEPLDAWGAHAVTHVMETADRPREGLRWLNEIEPALTGCNNFGGHLAWHRSLLHLQLGELDAALELHDAQIAIHLGRDYRDVANASTLLWRLEREGVPVGSRWQRLAELARERLGDHTLAFADVHYALALAGAGDHAGAARFVTSMREAALAQRGLYAEVSAQVGVPLAQGLVALTAGRADLAVANLAPIAPRLVRLGGSNAQRDVFAQAFIEAALATDPALARALLHQRLSQRPDNAYAKQRLARVNLAATA